MMSQKTYDAIPKYVVTPKGYPTDGYVNIHCAICNAGPYVVGARSFSLYTPGSRGWSRCGCGQNNWVFRGAAR